MPDLLPPTVLTVDNDEAGQSDTSGHSALRHPDE